tara:strand:+ start:2029 stop:2661 length:633 start_codon:yes stop_codon:yes gene_type:complete
MPAKLNTEFNYRYQVIGDTVWEKIKTLQGFLEGRKRAAVLEKVNKLKYESKLAELEHLKEKGLKYEVLNLEAEILETESHMIVSDEAYQLNRDEIDILNKLLKELYALAEPTRIKGYSDEQMFEANAVNEFTVSIAREIQAEIIANGRPSPAKIRNAMRNPLAWEALKKVGLIPNDVKVLEGNVNPSLELTLKVIENNKTPKKRRLYNVG